MEAIGSGARRGGRGTLGAVPDARAGGPGLLARPAPALAAALAAAVLLAGCGEGPAGAGGTAESAARPSIAGLAERAAGRGGDGAARAAGRPGGTVVNTAPAAAGTPARVTGAGLFGAPAAGASALPERGPSEGAQSAQTAQAVPLAAATVVPPVADASAPVGAPALFSGDGQPSPAARAAAPADRSLHTRAGWYASPAQYDYEALHSSPYTVLVDLDAAGSAAAAAADAMVAHRWAADAAAMAYFVKAADLAAAARLADALSAQGVPNVFLLVPPGAPAGR